MSTLGSRWQSEAQAAKCHHRPMDDLAQDDIDVGSVLRETYEIVGVLGRGGMGTVFLARHLRLPGKQVAVKVLQGAIASPELHQRFRREAEIVSRLGHPNVVEVLDFNTLEHGTPYLVLEFLRGESLHKRLKRGPLDKDTAFSIIRQVGSALQTAHKAGIVHRDLKPDNIFLVPTDAGGVVAERVKLLDFGISKMADSDSSLKTRDAVLIGTPQYMAPEQALGKNSTIDARTDVFALGCIVYEMLSGRGPFAGDLIAEVVYRVVHEQPEPLSKLVPNIADTVVRSVERAMRKEPAERYASITDFVSELTGIPLKTLSNPAMPVAPIQPLEQRSPSGISLDATITKPSKPPTSRDKEPERPAEAPALASPRPEPVRVASGGRGKWLALAIGIGAAVGIGIALAFRALPAKTTPPLPVPEPIALPADARPADVPHDALADTHPSMPAPEKAAPVIRPVRHVLDEPLPPEVQSDLQAAETALGAGTPEEAIRLARHSQRVKVNGHAYSILVRAHCLQGDLSNARAQWANVQLQDRHAVLSFCKTRGIDL
jgi:eukaryotic-like serine/threonine-protein kinase